MNKIILINDLLLKVKTKRVTILSRKCRLSEDFDLIFKINDFLEEYNEKLSKLEHSP